VRLTQVSRAAVLPVLGPIGALREETALRTRFSDWPWPTVLWLSADRGFASARGWCVNHKRLVRLMREDNSSVSAQAAVQAAHDRLTSQLAGLAEPGAPSGADGDEPAVGRRHYYVRLDEAFVYLAVVLDAFSRKVIGWAIEDHLKGEPRSGRFWKWH